MATEKLDLEKILKDKERFQQLFKQKIEEEVNKEPEIFALLKELKPELKQMCEMKVAKSQQLIIIKEIFGTAPSAPVFMKFYEKYGCKGVHEAEKADE
jgi:hypothetical protein